MDALLQTDRLTFGLSLYNLAKNEFKVHSNHRLCLTNDIAYVFDLLESTTLGLGWISLN